MKNIAKLLESAAAFLIAAAIFILVHGPIN